MLCPDANANANALPCLGDDDDEMRRGSLRRLLLGFREFYKSYAVGPGRRDVNGWGSLSIHCLFK
jgi:hypothetical protein